MSMRDWKLLPFDTAVTSRGSGAASLPQSEWLERGRFPVIGQGAEKIEGWTNREDLLQQPKPALVLYGGHTLRAKYVTRPFVAGPNVKILSPCSDIDARYLYYFLTYLPIEKKGYADHFPDVRRSNVPVPPINEQHRIVATLDTIHREIRTAASQVAAALERIQSLYVARLEFLFAATGNSWKRTTVRELVSDGVLQKPFDGNHGDIHPKRSDYRESGVPFLMASDLNDGTVDIDGCRFIEPHLAASLRTGFAYDGDVLLSHKGTIGRSAILRTAHAHAMLTPQLTAYRVLRASSLSNAFLLHCFNSPSFLEQLHSRADEGSTRAYIGITKQLDLEVSIPDIHEQEMIASSLDKLAVHAQSLRELYNRRLTAVGELKRSLLHHAFTGQL